MLRDLYLATEIFQFSGWKEMDEYMRENKLETIIPQLPPEGRGPQEKENRQRSRRLGRNQTS
ncbi:MAG: hypothetical protein IPJ38_01815 [Dechloromonas sp.]|uniref:Uncharacterized protein n=1 Tax=Candidatus Dechloromonas phosphorivorans TaxID=2899244 RepID=A0A935JWW2_9RHOO|nr:hypothetical protein [Candidatus Dechloromonas phosphorivorans]